MNRPLQMDQARLTRRDFIVSGAVVGSGLMLSIPLFAQEGASAQTLRPQPPRAPSAFLQIAADDTITIITPAVEMGQGGHTAMPMILMDELGGGWAHLQVKDAPPAVIYNNPLFRQQSTVGSFSVRDGTRSCDVVGAAAREMLIQAAAQQWGRGCW